MARARNLKPGFFKDAKVVACSFQARLLFQGLWCMADYMGRIKYVPIEAKMEIFPADDVDVPACMSELEKNGLIEIYADRSGAALVQVKNFTKHQNPHINEKQGKDKKPLPCLPGPQECKADESSEKPFAEQEVINAIKVLSEYYESDPADSLNLIPDSLKFSSEIPGDEAPPSDHKYTDDDMAFAQGMYKMILKSAPKTKKPNFDKWADCIRLMRERDELTHSEIAAVFRFANQDEFWKSIILNPSNLREKFAQLDAKMRSMPNEKRNGNTADRFQIDHEDTSWYAGEGSCDSGTGESDIPGITDDLHGLETSH